MPKAVMPRHVAIIMDGNGRFAESRGEPRLSGHRAGAQTVRDITTYSCELGLTHLTLYSFSSENWGRPQDEVSGLMELLRSYLVDELPTLKKNNVRLTSIGDTAKLPLLVRTLLKATEEQTKNNTGLRLTLALSYGSRDEIVNAAKKIAQDVKAGRLAVDAIDHAAFAQRLETHDVPDPELLIRTSGELRVSNFLLWQIAYSEIYVTEKAWPEFTRAEFDAALAAFSQRQRRFGLTGAQVKKR
jgi:undecaprenyl diphosphate synthase